MEKEAILVIPHAYSKTAKIRAVELAHGLSQDYNVYCQKWNDIVQVNDKNLLLRLLKKLYYGIYSLIPIVRISQDKGIHYLEVPLLQPPLLYRLLGEHLAWEIARHINSTILKTVLKKFNPKINKIIIGAVHYDIKILRDFKVWLDVCDIDLFDEEAYEKSYLENNIEFVKKNKGFYEGIFVPNNYYKDWLASNFNIQSEIISNGAWVSEMRNPDPKVVDNLKRKYNLNNKIVVGYIGSHHKAAGIDFLIDVFRYTASKSQDIVFLVVGPISEIWEPLIKRLNNHPQLIFAGAIPSNEIVNYLGCIDICMYCPPPSYKHRSLVTPLKILEYSAAQKPIISTPLKLLEETKWPHVIIPEYNTEAWFNAIQKLKTLRWEPEWDKLIEEYDWNNIAKNLAKFLSSTSSTTYISQDTV